MTNFKPITGHARDVVVQLLRKLYGPSTLVHIGAGKGIGPMHQWRQWDLAQALLIDAGPDADAWGSDGLELKPGWCFSNQVIGAGEPVSWHTASTRQRVVCCPPQPLKKFGPA
ncbi:MAG: hypothetical protein IPG42_12140 [Betaproteobacteria bacterium]|nr:hypothetical protein [Betaproteobacteria bacterium]